MSNGDEFRLMDPAAAEWRKKLAGWIESRIVQRVIVVAIVVNAVVLGLETDRGLITRNIVLAANIMLEHGIRVYLYPGFTHAKAAIFDGWASVGSANWDNLSFHTNKELNIATSDPEFVGQLHEHLFDVDLAQSVELTEPFPERWSDHLMEVVADYLL